MIRVKLGTLVDVVRTPLPKIGSGSLSYVATGDVGEHDIRRIQLHQYGEQPSRANLKCQPGDVIMARMANTTKVLVIDERTSKFAYSTGFAALRIKSEKITPIFLANFLRSKGFQRQKDRASTGATQKAILDEALLQLEVSVPNLDLQANIAEKLSVCRKLIQSATLQKNLLQELRQASVEEFLSSRDWDVAPLGSVTVKIGSGSTPRGGKRSYVDSGPALVRSMNVHDGNFVWNDLARLSQSQANQLRSVDVKPNDIFLNITGASVARCCVAPEDLGEARVNQHVMILRADPKKLNPIFLETILIFPKVKTKLLQLAGAGSTREAITKTQMEEFAIPCPPLNLQDEFARKLRVLNRLNFEVRDKTQTLGEVFESLENQIFSGVNE